MRQVNLIGRKMQIEHLLIELELKKDGLKHINNYLIEEFGDNYCTYKGVQGEMYNKIIGLLHANSALLESMEKTLLNYQEQIDLHYAELLKTDV